ncbi:hypothetical protein PMIT1327_00362 [Prochlorococcus marinus str. MIT 1327]|nr:hypothetical protein PMIT1312_00042 [Prochlorococcus marinus str. MIT 1312]KZR83592.1 hypothetical protein PMIT1327_00362 [Prochlorococcus marinus str. MIT 1327]
MAYFKQPALPPGKARLSDLTKLRDVAAIGCSDPDLAIHQVQVYDWFEQWNERFFSNRLRPVHVNVSLTNYGKNLGLCIGFPVQYIEIHPQCWKGKAVHHSQAIGNTEMPSAAWVVLHEMIHLAGDQAGQETWGADHNCHTTPIWVGWCNFIAEQLELPLSYAEMKRGKTKADPDDGYRANVWKPRRGMEPVIREGTRLASYDETRCFPFSETDVLMQENKEVRKIKGEEVERLPSF